MLRMQIEREEIISDRFLIKRHMKIQKVNHNEERIKY